jgi:hypothetical protein
VTALGICLSLQHTDKRYFKLAKEIKMLLSSWMEKGKLKEINAKKYNKFIHFFHTTEIARKCEHF